MKKIIVNILLVLCCQGAVRAQQLVLQGKVTFERKENMYKQLDDDGSWSREMRARIPKYKTDLFQLSFNTNKSLYKISKEEENTILSQGWLRGVAWNNIVLCDLVNERAVTEKNIYEKNYRITDSMPAYEWKLTGEYREVAGYNCRKATTIIMDSLFVIAFYTDEIPVSAGPEGLAGLPGMILGAVVPKLNITYFATKVEAAVVSDKDFQYTPAKKADAVNKVQMYTEIDEAMKDWGKYGRQIYWRAVF